MNKCKDCIYYAEIFNGECTVKDIMPVDEYDDACSSFEKVPQNFNVELTDKDVLIIIKALGWYSLKNGKTVDDEDINRVYRKLYAQTKSREITEQAKKGDMNV